MTSSVAATCVRASRSGSCLGWRRTIACTSGPSPGRSQSARSLAGNAKELLPVIRKALDPREEDTFGPSPIWDAVAAAVETLAKAEGRRAVLLVTDGRATGNRLSPEEAAALAIAAGVVVSVVGKDWEMTIQQDATTGVRVRPGVALERIASITGGLYLRDRRMPAAPGPILDRLLADLHGRYTLGFTPPDPRRQAPRARRPGPPPRPDARAASSISRRPSPERPAADAFPSAAEP